MALSDEDFAELEQRLYDRLYWLAWPNTPKPVYVAGRKPKPPPRYRHWVRTATDRVGVTDAATFKLPPVITQSNVVGITDSAAFAISTFTQSNLVGITDSAVFTRFTPPATQLELWHVFTDDFDGTPATADSGQSWTRSRNRPAAAPVISGGRFIDADTASGVSANYLTAQLGATVAYLEADFDYAVAGNTNGANAVLAAWAVNLPADAALSGVPDSPCHCVVTPTLLNYSVFTGGSIISAGTHGFSPALVPGVTYHMEIVVDKANSRATVLCPDGQTATFTHPLIGSVTAPYVTAEIYLPDAANDQHSRFQWFGAGAVVPAAKPTISGITPNPAPSGAVTITGTNFVTGGLAVSFGGVPATGVNVVNSTTITCNTPAHANGVVPVTVRTKAGTSVPGSFTYQAAVGAPTITSIAPNPGAAGPVTVNGTNFLSGATVSFGGSAATSVVVVSGNQITCAAPAHADGAVNVTVTTTSGTSSAFVFTYQASVVSSPHLPFDIPDMSASPKIMLAHWHYFPISLENGAPNSDYWATSWLPAPTSYGGTVRNRPKLNGAPLSGDWKFKNCAKEIADAQSAGVNGFFLNIGWLDSSGGGWPLLHFAAFIAAAQSVTGFYIVPMLDVSILGAANVNTVAGIINQYYGLPSTWMAGGTMIIGVYGTDTNPPSWYASLVSALSGTYGITAKFVFVYAGAGAAPSYAANAYATGTWGPKADAGIAIGSTNPSVSGVHARGEKYLSPVWVSDERPGSGVWNESLNTLALTNFWSEVISVDPDIVQMCTWQDYSEGSIFGDSVLQGLVPADISAYYMIKWKTGSYPTIVRDGLYLSYRNHVSGAARLGGQTSIMNKWVTPGTTTRFAIEALTFLKAPADVTVTLNGVTTTFTNVPAGVTRNPVPVTSAGNVSGTIKRGGATVVSLPCPIPIRSTLWADSWNYCMFGSLRGTAGQFDCQTTSSGAIPSYP